MLRVPSPRYLEDCETAGYWSLYVVQFSKALTTVLRLAFKVEKLAGNRNSQTNEQSSEAISPMS